MKQLVRIVFIASALAIHSQVEPSSAEPQRDVPQAQTSTTVSNADLSFHLVSANQGWLLLSQQLYWTNDGGTTWADITPTPPSPSLYQGEGKSRVYAVFFLDARNGWAVTSDSANQFALARTADFGASWQTQILPPALTQQDGAAVAAIHMFWLDSQTGWFVARRATSSNFDIGTLFKTTDGGDSWTRLTIPIGDPVFFVTADLGWAAGGAAGNELHVTRDGGKTWDQQRVGGTILSPGRPQALGQPSPPFRFGDLRQGLPLLPKFFNAREGVLPVMVTAGNDSHLDLYRTRDGGESWQLGSSTRLGSEIAPGTRFPIAILDAGQSVIVLPQSRQIETRSANGSRAVTTSRDPIVEGIRELDMTTSRTGWAKYTEGSCAGGDKSRCTQTTRLLRTSDGGVSWDALALPTRDFQTLPSPYQGEGKQPTSPTSLTQTLTGQGFDACGAPTVNQFQNWWINSPYMAYNLYIGGAAMASCSQFTASTVSQIANQGWKFFPTWVGPQAPCSIYSPKFSSNTATAYAEGAAQADLAIDAAYNLGLTDASKAGSIIYYDLEAYGGSPGSCRDAADSFIRGWSARLKARGNLAGAYGASCGSAVSDWANADPSEIPDILWIAHWIYSSYNSTATVWGASCLDDSLWVNHQRLRQYAGGHNETWGGVTRNIDSDVLDGAVVSLSNAPKLLRKYYFPLMRR